MYIYVCVCWLHPTSLDFFLVAEHGIFKTAEQVFKAPPLTSHWLCQCASRSATPSTAVMGWFPAPWDVQIPKTESIHSLSQILIIPRWLAAAKTVQTRVKGLHWAVNIQNNDEGNVSVRTTRKFSSKCFHLRLFQLVSVDPTDRKDNCDVTRVSFAEGVVLYLYGALKGLEL